MERLNKYLAHAGLGSRRHCEELIVGGHVSVDDVVVRELGTKVDPSITKVSVDGQPLSTERPVYWLLNKPRGYLCTNDDPGGRPRAIDLVDHIRQRVYTVGRLDEDSEGLLLLTNDGDLAHKLMHPRFGIEKTYLVQVAGLPTREQLDKLLEGVWMSDGHVKPKAVKRLKQQGESTWLEIVLSEGKNREIRRMLAGLGHKVMRLKRIALGTIHLGRLARGKSRPLSPPELTALQFAVRHATSEDVAEESANESVEAPREERPRHTAFADQPPRKDRRPGDRGDRPAHAENRGQRPQRGDFRPPRPGDRRGPGRPAFRPGSGRPTDRRDQSQGDGERRDERPTGPPRDRRPFSGTGRPQGDRRGPGRPGSGGPANNRAQDERGGERRDRRPANGPPPYDQRPRGPGRPPGDRRGPGRPAGDRPAFRSGEGRPTERRDDRPSGPPRDRRNFGGPGGRPPGRGPGRPDGEPHEQFQGGGERRPHRHADGPPRRRRPGGPGRPPGDRRAPGRPGGGPGRSGRGPTSGPGRPGRPRPIVPKSRHKRKPS